MSKQVNGIDVTAAVPPKWLYAALRHKLHQGEGIVVIECLRWTHAAHTELIEQEDETKITGVQGVEVGGAPRMYSIFDVFLRFEDAKTAAAFRLGHDVREVAERAARTKQELDKLMNAMSKLKAQADVPSIK